jgi:transcriptional regulator with XRE-family HTH domain
MTRANETDETEKGWFETKLEDPEFRRLYAREDLIEGFLHQVEQAMKEKGVSRAQLAERLACSSANVTRIMRRSSNLTAATMADMAFALDLRVRVYLDSLSTWLVGPYFGNVAGACTTELGSYRPTSRPWTWPGWTPRIISRGKLPVSTAEEGQAA